MIRIALVLAALIGVSWSFESAAGEAPVPWQSTLSVLAANEARGASMARQARNKVRDKAKAAQAPAEPRPIPPLPVRKTAVAEPEVWSPQEIAEAQAQCAQIMKKIDAVFLPHPPIKEGSCGNAAPIRLMSLGTKPQVSFEPPALVNCQMAAALHTWITREVQPLAMKHLGEGIAKVEVMSDYSCRTSFGRRTGRLSEHAYADALDIRGFVTETGKKTHVLDTWGITKRDIAAQIAAAKAEAEREAAARAEANMAAQKNLKDDKSKGSDAKAPEAVASKLGTPGSGLAKRVRSDGVERITVTLPGGGAPKPKSLEYAARLGGPKPRPSSQDAQAQDAPPKLAALGSQSIAIPAPGPRAQFLRAAHAAACRIFGTTLGPEANEDHRNHFHVDMAERKIKKICD
jgi:hypothetical protein